MYAVGNALHSCTSCRLGLLASSFSLCHAATKLWKRAVGLSTSKNLDSLIGLLHVGIVSRNDRAPPRMTHCFHDDHSGGKLKTIPCHLQEVVMMTPSLLGKKTHGGEVSRTHTRAHTHVYLGHLWGHYIDLIQIPHLP